MSTTSNQRYLDVTVRRTFPSCTLRLGELKAMLEEFEELRLPDEDNAILQVYPPRGESSECSLALVSRATRS